jgi:hypothetical protein
MVSGSFALWYYSGLRRVKCKGGWISFYGTFGTLRLETHDYYVSDHMVNTNGVFVHINVICIQNFCLSSNFECTFLSKKFALIQTGKYI